MKVFQIILLSIAVAACTKPPESKVVNKAVEPRVEVAAPEAPKVEAPKPDPNRELAQRVKRTLENDGKIEAAGIDVTAADGLVTLWGTAATEDDKGRATRLAVGVAGVKSVNNRLTVIRGS
ncbi:MAG TPA: BON domain-containing protein [Burkholderiales bacterium]